MRDEDGGDIVVRSQRLVDDVRVGAGAVLEREVDGVTAVDADEVNETLAEDADGDDEDAARRG